MVGSTGRLVTVRVNPLADLGAAPAQSVRIGTIFLGDPDTSGRADFQMTGAAKGLSTLAVDVGIDGLSLASNPDLAIDPDNGLWTWETQIILSSLTQTLAARAGVSVDAMNDVAFVDLPEPRTDIPLGIFANTDMDKVVYLAGFPDRFVETRSFGFLDRFLFERNVFISLIKVASKGSQPFVWIADVPRKITVRIDVARALESVAEEQESILARFETGDREKLRQIALRAVSERFAQSATLVPLGQAQSGSTSNPWTVAAPHATSLPDPSADVKVYINAILDRLLKLENQGLQLGLLFHDKLRFREIGVTRSQDVIFSLSLDANEEAQITVTTSTLRRRNIEEVTNQEVERELELSSQWSNDLAFGVDLNTSTNQGVNFGGDLGAQGSSVPLTAGVQAGYSASQTSSETSTFAVQNARERTARTATRMRNEHKIAVERSEELGLQRGTVKTISNRGSQRPRRLDYLKLFKKVMVTYERHDGMLCLRLSVPNPSADVRQRFRARLPTAGQTDGAPQVGEEAAGAGQTATKVQIVRHTWRLPSEELPTFWIYPVPPHTAQISLNIKNGSSSSDTSWSTSVPADWQLIKKPVVRVTSALRQSRVWRLDGPEGVQPHWVDHKYELTDETATDIKPGFIAPAGLFSGLGNKMSWAMPAEWLTGIAFDGNARLRLDYVHIEHFLNAGRLVDLTFEVESEWRAPVDPIADDVAPLSVKPDEEEHPTFEELVALRDIAVRDFVPSVMDQAFRFHLSPLTGSVPPSLLPEYFAIEEVQVDAGPYWADETTRQEHAALVSVLTALPFAFPVSDILVPQLVASEAVVYLPIRPGREREVLSLLTVFDNAQVEAIASDIDEFRDTKFGATAAASELPSVEKLTNPQGIGGTPRTESSWKEPWEKPQRRFEVLAHWHELVPTDGADCETVLSKTSASDEAYLKSKD